MVDVQQGALCTLTPDVGTARVCVEQCISTISNQRSQELGSFQRLIQRIVVRNGLCIEKRRQHMVVIFQYLTELRFQRWPVKQVAHRMARLATLPLLGYPAPGRTNSLFATASFTRLIQCGVV